MGRLMRPRKLYDVYNKGEYLFTGNRETIAHHLQYSVGTIKNYILDSVNGETPDDGLLILPVEDTDRVIYGYYRGDKLITVGTRDEIAEELGVSVETVISNASVNRRQRAIDSDGTYAVPLSVEEAEAINAENAELDGYRVFTIYKGRKKKIFRLSENGITLAIGDASEIAREINRSRATVYAKSRNPNPSDNYRIEEIDAPNPKKYAVYSPDRMLKAYGTREEVARELDIHPNSVHTLASERNRRKLWTYAVPTN